MVKVTVTWTVDEHNLPDEYARGAREHELPSLALSWVEEEMGFLWIEKQHTNPELFEEWVAKLER